MSARDEIVVRIDTGGKRTRDLKGGGLGPSQQQPIEDIGKKDNGIEKVIAIATPADDVQGQIDLGFRRFFNKIRNRRTRS
jgi:hypothetical protein